MITEGQEERLLRTLPALLKLIKGKFVCLPQVYYDMEQLYRELIDEQVCQEVIEYMTETSRFDSNWNPSDPYSGYEGFKNFWYTWRGMGCPIGNKRAALRYWERDGLESEEYRISKALIKQVESGKFEKMTAQRWLNDKWYEKD
jgi:hypothetical protein